MAGDREFGGQAAILPSFRLLESAEGSLASRFVDRFEDRAQIGLMHRAAMAGNSAEPVGQDLFPLCGVDLETPNSFARGHGLLAAHDSPVHGRRRQDWTPGCSLGGDTCNHSDYSSRHFG
jgi:hypothetical protein